MAAYQRLSCRAFFKHLKMEQQMVVISRIECEQLLTYLERARGYCLNARPADFSPEGLRAEPTAFYSGAAGYARATMSMVIDTLQSHM